MPIIIEEDAKWGMGNDQHLWAFESKIEGEGKQAVVLGVDGGGTGTTCVCVAAPLSSRGEGTLLSRAETNSSNHNSVGDGLKFSHRSVSTIARQGRGGFSSTEVAARRAIEESMAIALAKAELPRSAVLSVCLALSGVDRESDIKSHMAWARKLFTQDVEISVQNDAVAALASGTAGKLYGCAVIAGTGTIALGFNEDGKSARASGAGPLLGDQGSGYAIASQALAAVMRAYDGRGCPTTLTEAILKHLKLSSPEDLIGWVYKDTTWARVAALVPVVKACAQDGDSVAKQLLDDAVAELACSVKAVVQSLHLNDGKKSFPFVMVGGVFENKNEDSWDLCKPLSDKVLDICPGAQVVRPKVEPAMGAAMLAWRQYEDSLSEDAQDAAGAVS